ncbi:MAG: type toxin-antitoxin system RelE/ParE family toxin [Mucilaginibacter sp.]|nr:type toxin-antitoxin system RelE/ParE family toxin [Mucilaginibacter sp.]
MSREITWSTRALKEWVDILNYWTKRNKSYAYSIKLDRLVKEKFDLISKSPEIGKATDFPVVRIKFIQDYQVYYRIQSDHIEILAIWDTRRDPKKFKL